MINLPPYLPHTTTTTQISPVQDQTKILLYNKEKCANKIPILRHQPTKTRAHFDNMCEIRILFANNETP